MTSNMMKNMTSNMRKNMISDMRKNMTSDMTLFFQTKNEKIAMRFYLRYEGQPPNLRYEGHISGFFSYPALRVNKKKEGMSEFHKGNLQHHGLAPKPEIRGSYLRFFLISGPQGVLGQTNIEVQYAQSFGQCPTHCSYIILLLSLCV